MQFLYFKLCLSVMLDSFSCPFTPILSYQYVYIYLLPNKVYFSVLLSQILVLYIFRY